MPGEITAPFQAKAAELGIYIGGNQFEADPEWPLRHFNTSWLIDPAGQVILRYRRIHTAQWVSPHDLPMPTSTGTAWTACSRWPTPSSAGSGCWPAARSSSPSQRGC